MAQPTALHPTVLWAQRNDTVMLTVQLIDVRDEKLTLEESCFKFDGVGGTEGRPYSCELTFYKDIIPQESKHRRTDRGLYFLIKKKESGPYWPRLLLDSSKKHPYLKTDFNRWKDEDESEDEEPDTSDMSSLMQQMGGMGGMGMGGMGGMPGMGGMGGMPGMGGMGMGDMPGMGGTGGSPNLDDLGDEESDSDDEPMPELEGDN